MLGHFVSVPFILSHIIHTVSIYLRLTNAILWKMALW